MSEIDVEKVYEAYVSGEPITEREFRALAEKLGDDDEYALNEQMHRNAEVIPDVQV